jgi:hypothetical protein
MLTSKLLLSTKALILISCVAACGPPEPTQNCVPGKVEQCVCPGNTAGVQSCNNRGTGYLTCDCNNGSGNGSSTSFVCLDNTCSDPGDGSGNYASLTDCEAQCGAGGNSDCDNTFMVGSEGPYNLGGPAEIIHFGPMWNTTTNYEIRLFSSSVTGTAQGPSYVGTGDMIFFDLHSSGAPGGSYTYYPNQIPPDPPADTSTPKYFLNQDMNVYSDGMAFPIAGTALNTLNVVDNGRYSYDITFDFDAADGRITGCYSGRLGYWDNEGGGSGSRVYQNSSL